MNVSSCMKYAYLFEFYPVFHPSIPNGGDGGDDGAPRIIFQPVQTQIPNAPRDQMSRSGKPLTPVQRTYKNDCIETHINII